MPRPSPHLMNQVSLQQGWMRWRNPNLPRHQNNPRHQKNPRLRRTPNLPRNQKNSRLRSTRCGWCRVECEEILDFKMCCLVNSSHTEELHCRMKEGIRILYIKIIVEIWITRANMMHHPSAVWFFDWIYAYSIDVRTCTTTSHTADCWNESNESIVWWRGLK